MRSEITAHLSFTPKETDIYKIHQSGDLANLSGLDAASLSRLPSLLSLRDALYSAEFRNFLSQVTGCGPLSGEKTDMAINVYTPGSYLLCHDDVIGSRRLSYILYLTDPEEGNEWRPEWGGALRLYSTVEKVSDDGKKMTVPSPDYTVSIPPSFGQLSFFEVQPGESYHDVEEVSYPEQSIWAGDKVLWEEEVKKRTRMAISGWFHIPMKGEDGFEDGLEEKSKEKSSLAQLEGHTEAFDEPSEDCVLYSAPARELENTTTDGDPPDVDSALSESECDLLLRFLAPSYVSPDMAEQLSASFEEDSFLRLAQVLNPKFSVRLRTYVEDLQNSSERYDTKNSAVDGQEDPRQNQSFPFAVASPPHKHRYVFASQESLKSMRTAVDNPLYDLVHELLPSLAFRKWLAEVTGYKAGDLVGHNILTRRFRKGQDYALASGYGKEGDPDMEPRLEFTLDITPLEGWEDDEDANEDAVPENLATANGTKPIANGESSKHVSVIPTKPPIEPGGTEIYMAADDDSSHPTLPSVGRDPAVYRSAADDDDDGILFTSAPAWNRLNIVLRDAGSLRFVKFVSSAAPCDRWDVKGTIMVRDEARMETGEGDGDDVVDEDEEGEEEEGLEEESET